MLTAFKLLPTGIKFAWVIGLLIALASLLGAVGYTQYQRGLNVSKVEIVKYEKKVLEKQAQLDKANAKTTVKVVTDYKDRVVYVDRVVTKTQTVIQNTVPEQFKLSQGWVYTYNQSVLGKDSDPAKSAVDTTSAFSERDALEIINRNNGQCISREAQINALQAWIEGVRANAQTINR